MADAKEESKDADDVKEKEETVSISKTEFEELHSSIKSLSDEATKNKHLARAAQKERDDLKKKIQKQTDPTGQDYKDLWQESNDKATKLLEKAKAADIKVALHAQLQKAKVAADRLDAALDLVDKGLIEWDEDSGVDGHTITAAVSKLKSKHAFLFETTVKATDSPILPGDNKGQEQNRMAREDFMKLPTAEKVKVSKAKVVLFDT
jgi:DNA repair exonuclease SbcCD ATPase subunit